MSYLYEWKLPDGTVLPIVHPDLARAQETVRELIEPDVRAALAAAGDGARALDLACNEGWWSHRLLDWGAARVVGVEARAQTVERARGLRDAFGLDESRLELARGRRDRASPG